MKEGDSWYHHHAVSDTVGLRGLQRRRTPFYPLPPHTIWDLYLSAWQGFLADTPVCKPIVGFAIASAFTVRLFTHERMKAGG